MKVQEFEGHGPEIEHLLRSARAGRLVHAYLLCGARGCGKKTLAMALSMALHCTGEGEKPCLACGPCARMLAGTHPDHVEVRTDKAVLPVKEIRDLIDGLSSKEVAVTFLRENTLADGIISTKPPIVKAAKEQGLLAIQRFFLNA